MASYRYLMNIAYLGSVFRGAQRQIPGGLVPRIEDPLTIQGRLEIGLKFFYSVNEPIVVLSSRTDSGVHAINSTCHVDLISRNGKPYNPGVITIQLNRYLKKSQVPIRVLKTFIVPDTFHCRHNTISRTYLYRMILGQRLNESTESGSVSTFFPIEEWDRSFFLCPKKSFDITLAKEAAKMIEGFHDFRTFMKKFENSEYKNTRRSIEYIKIIDGPIKQKYSSYSWPSLLLPDDIEYLSIDIYIKSTGFLYRQVIGDHQKYLKRITKTLYYGKLPKTDSLSFPVTELATELFSDAQKGKSLQRLHFNDAARISRNACVPPCSLVLALLYLERLKKCNPDYLEKTAPSELFLVSLMVSSKFLFDDGESDEVYMDEWAASAGISVKELVQLEKKFLKAIDWGVYVKELTFWKKLKELETRVASREGMLRGYYTYTELGNLMAIIEIHNIIQCIAAISVILAATYTAGLLTIVGSVFFASQVPGTSLYVNKMNKLENANMSAVIFDNMEPHYDTLKTEVTLKCLATRNLGITDMLQTSIFLASIKTNMTEQVESSDDNAQYISWDYWNIPVMKWLSDSCQYIMNCVDELPFKHYPYYLETSVSNMKCMELEDQIHKATKTRIQDQMESSWHKEWTDTYNFAVYFSRIFPQVFNSLKN